MSVQEGPGGLLLLLGWDGRWGRWGRGAGQLRSSDQVYITLASWTVCGRDRLEPGEGLVAGYNRIGNHGGFHGLGCLDVLRDVWMCWTCFGSSAK